MPNLHTGQEGEDTSKMVGPPVHMATTLKQQAEQSPSSSFQKEGGSEQLHQVLCVYLDVVYGGRFAQVRVPSRSSFTETWQQWKLPAGSFHS